MLPEDCNLNSASSLAFKAVYLHVSFTSGTFILTTGIDTVLGLSFASRQDR
jgi:hypothetical protein